ncbi:MAG: hypothetical protein CMJ78_22720 [Planctomycetaceae bacterium]|nr:hypothetical protein [Planctomycetaceae bacterium]
MTARDSGLPGSDRPVETNITAARWLIKLHHFTAETKCKDWATHALRYVTIPRIARSMGLKGGLLSADFELRTEPLHLVVIGERDNETSQALFRAAQATPFEHRCIHWFSNRTAAESLLKLNLAESNESAGYIFHDGQASEPIQADHDFGDAINLHLRKTDAK